MNDLAKEIVAELEPAGGWWKSSTEDALIEAAETMLESMDADEVQSTLEDLIGALRSEYGE